MAEIFFASSLYSLIGGLWLTRSGHARHTQALILGLVLCFALSLLAGLNFQWVVFEQKFASTFAFDLFEGHDPAARRPTFLLQTLVNWPVFSLTGVWWAAIGTNIAILVLGFILFARHDPRLALWLLAPALVNFSLFSLRDPLIAALCFVLALGLLDPLIWRRALGQAVGAVAFLLVRPENVVLLVLANALAVVIEKWRTMWGALLLPLAAVAAVYGGQFAPQALGLDGVVRFWDLPLVLNEFFTSRAERWGAELGGGSNILGGALTELGFLPRYAIQIASFFVLPFPFEITSWLLAMAFVDSLVFIALSVQAHRVGPAKILGFFWVYVLAVSLFSANYGNVFRMRLPAYSLLLAALFAGRVRR